MGKIVTRDEFKTIRKELKVNNRKVVLCHGVFDLVHLGHILHFEEAKSLGDILVVSITANNYVRKGPDRPYFDDEMRLKFLSAIEVIDYVILSENYTVSDIIESVEPDIYVKGQEYAKEEDDITGKIGEETALVKKHGGKIYFTTGQVFSSTKLINNLLPALSEEIKQFIYDFKTRYDFNDIREYIEKIKDLKVLVVGEIIIDEYVFCSIQGLMSKDTGYSSRYINSEQYLGGAVAIARHIAQFSENVCITSIIGNEKNIHSRLLNDLSNQMRIDLEYSDTYKTIIKTRYITENEKREEFHKIFSINNLSNNMQIDNDVMIRFRNKLTDIISSFDVVILCDFGHGLIDENVRELLENKAKFLAINCQTNSSNYGMNLITKYKRADTFVLDQKELKLAFSDYSLEEIKALKKLSKHFESAGWLTQGAAGATAIDEEGKITQCPAFTLKVKDTIGAGDAFFSLASTCAAVGAPYEVGAFVGNIAGALASNIIGNKTSIEKVNILKYMNTLLNI